jgi:hypothetical protein
LLPEGTTFPSCLCDHLDLPDSRTQVERQKLALGTAIEIKNALSFTARHPCLWSAWKKVSIWVAITSWDQTYGFLQVCVFLLSWCWWAASV